MKTVTRTRHGVVAELNGKYWYSFTDGGHGGGICKGWGDIEDAEVSDPKYCRTPTAMTYKGSPYEQELKRARLVPVTITTTYEVEE